MGSGNLFAPGRFPARLFYRAARPFHGAGFFVNGCAIFVSGLSRLFTGEFFILPIFHKKIDGLSGKVE
jgi:hypothetical protein